jgi:hypothetical protein
MHDLPVRRLASDGKVEIAATRGPWGLWPRSAPRAGEFGGFQYPTLPLKITPNTLTRAYRDAGYFARNIRTIEVLLDRDAVASGAAAAGQPWQYYDLGHGWCTYTFFEQCPHRMACAKCDFYAPKDSSKGQLLEASGNLQQMLAAVPLTDDERAAVDDGRAALDKLLDRLADVPTPAGPTPRQIGAPTAATMLPITAVTHRDGCAHGSFNPGR